MGVTDFSVHGINYYLITTRRWEFYIAKVQH